MFSGMQDVLNKLIKGQNEPPTDDGLIPILKAKELLAKEKYQLAFQRLPHLLNLDTLQFDNHCTTLLERFAEFVQLLPETQNSYFSRLGGILDHGFHRAILASSLCRTYFLPKEATEQHRHLNQQQILWAYAVFSAGLLHDVGKTAVDLHVTIFDRYTEQTKPWLLWEGSMIGAGTHYRFDFSAINQDEFRRRATLLIARQLMPTQSYLWLASDPNVLSAWLAMLEDDYRASGLIGEIIPSAEAQLLLQELEMLKNEAQKDSTEKDENQSEESAADKMDQAPDKITEKSDRKKHGADLSHIETAEKFYAWLKEAIEKDHIKANTLQSGIIRVQEGVLLTQAIFEKFVQTHPQRNQSATAVAEAVIKTGPIAVDPTTQSQVHQFADVGKTKNNVITAVVATQVNMIFPQNVTPEIHQNFVKIPLAALLPPNALFHFMPAVTVAPTITPPTSSR